MKNVLKRDGRIEPFDYAKIDKAVSAAAKEVGDWRPVISVSFDEDLIPVDDIHDEVERQLMKISPKIAKAYILYRQLM